MALITCRECGHSISDQARACPQCGAPAPSRARERTRKAETAALLVAGLGVLLYIYAVQGPAQPGTLLLSEQIIAGGVAGWLAVRSMAWWRRG